jgi:hypothetical protein
MGRATVLNVKIKKNILKKEKKQDKMLSTETRMLLFLNKNNINTMKIIIKKAALVKKLNVLKNIVNAIIQESSALTSVNVKIVKMDPKFLSALTIRITLSHISNHKAKTRLSKLPIITTLTQIKTKIFP